jgi:uncharacterized protein (DUF3084 family)
MSNSEKEKRSFDAQSTEFEEWLKENFDDQEIRTINSSAIKKWLLKLYPYKEQAKELATRLSASQERCEELEKRGDNIMIAHDMEIKHLEAQVKELAELLHKEEIHRISDVQMQQIKIQSLEEQLESE